MRRQTVLLVIAFMVLVAAGIGSAGIATARDVAGRSRIVSTSASAAVAAEQEAHLFWDNPFQRMLFLAISTTDIRPGPTCPAYEVTAFTFFGVVVDQVLVDCKGVRR